MYNVVFHTDSEEVSPLQNLNIATISYAHTCLYQNKAYRSQIKNLFKSGIKWPSMMTFFCIQTEFLIFLPILSYILI